MREEMRRGRSCTGAQRENGGTQPPEEVACPLHVDTVKIPQMRHRCVCEREREGERERERENHPLDEEEELCQHILFCLLP